MIIDEYFMSEYSDRHDVFYTRNETIVSCCFPIQTYY